MRALTAVKRELTALLQLFPCVLPPPIAVLGCGWLLVSDRRKATICEMRSLSCMMLHSLI